MRISDAPTSLLDVAPTILSVLDKADGSGFNLEDVPVRQRPFLVFDDKDEAARVNKYLIEGSVYDSDSCRFQTHLELNTNVEAYQPGTEIWFGLTGNGDAYMGSGWSICQSIHCWSNGHAADIVLPIAKADKDLELQVRFIPFVNEEKLPQQRINVAVNGTSLTTWLTSGPALQTATVRIPASLAGDGLLNIKFQFPDAASPKALNLGGDARTLGIALAWLRLDIIDSQ